MQRYTAAVLANVWRASLESDAAHACDATAAALGAMERLCTVSASVDEIVDVLRGSLGVQQTNQRTGVCRPLATEAALKLCIAAVRCGSLYVSVGGWVCMQAKPSECARADAKRSLHARVPWLPGPGGSGTCVICV